jgi:lysophospholipase L1-like esterase
MRRLAVLAALTLSLSLVACSSGVDDAAASDSDLESAPPHVLALGDSMTFAWDPRIEKDIHKVDASKYRGFPDLIGEHLGAAVDNAACPGETSGAFLDPNGEDNGCRTNRAAYRLHTDWRGADDQVAFVTAYLEDAIAKHAPPALITITLGGNDLLLVQKHCNGLPGILSAGCKLGRLPFAEHAYGEHIEDILLAIDATGYTGKVVLLTTYAPDYSDGIATFGLRMFNGELKEHADKAQGKAHGMQVRVADAYAAFEEKAKAHDGKTCATGLLIPNGDGTCDIHPTAEGHALIAKTMLDAAGL